jgi:hypothetical protein
MSEPVYYIENIRQGGDYRIFWRPNGHGYTANPNEAWLLSRSEAERICRTRPAEDVMREVSEMHALAVLRVPRAVRPPSDPGAPRAVSS